MGCENLSDNELLKQLEKLTRNVQKGKGLGVSIAAFASLINEAKKRGLKK